MSRPKGGLLNPDAIFSCDMEFIGWYFGMNSMIFNEARICNMEARWQTSESRNHLIRPSEEFTFGEDFYRFEPFIRPVAAECVKSSTRCLKEMARASAVPAHPVDPDAQRKEWRLLLSGTCGVDEEQIPQEVEKSDGTHRVSIGLSQKSEDEARQGLEAALFRSSLDGPPWPDEVQMHTIQMAQ